MPQPNHRPVWASNDDYTMISLAVVVVGLAFGAYLVWYFHHGAVSAAVMRLQHWQMRLIHQVTNRYDLSDRQVLAADPQAVTFPQLLGLCRDVGTVFRVPVALCLLSLAALCYVSAAPARFCRPLDLDGLIREQAKSFPTISAFVSRHLALVGPHAGEPRPADPALHPAEWIDRWARDDRGRFDQRRAHRELARQLGPLWRGVASAAPHVRCLFAVFALHLAKRRSEALDLLGHLSASLPSDPRDGAGGPDQPLAFPTEAVAFADDLLRDPDLVQPALAIAGRHGYTAPALMSLLSEARLCAGVLAPGQFAFLKLVDRRLWYALHALGFPSDGPGWQPHPNPRVEAIGARDHWECEGLAGQPLFKPMIDRALAAIRAAAGEGGAGPEEA